MARTKGVVKRVVVTPDKHFPYADMPAIKVLCKSIEMVKPDAYIDLGDVGEWAAFSHWKYARKKAPPLEFMIEDFDTVYFMLTSSMLYPFKSKRICLFNLLSVEKENYHTRQKIFMRYIKSLSSGDSITFTESKSIKEDLAPN